MPGWGVDALSTNSALVIAGADATVRGGQAPGPDDLRAPVNANRGAISDAVQRHKGRSVAIFGSVARGDATADSDIDRLVDFEENSSLFDLLHLTEELEQLLGRPVDVVSTRGLKPGDDHIRREAVPISMN